MRLSAARFVQGLKELTVRVSALTESYGIYLPSNAPSVGSIPRFKDVQGNLEWFDLDLTLDALEALKDAVENLPQSGNSSSQSQAIQELQQSITQLQNSFSNLSNALGNKENSGVAQILLDAHKQAFDHNQFVTNAVVNESLIARDEFLTDTLYNLHPFNEARDYLFNHFYSANTAPFITGNSGTGANTQFLTGTSEGFFRLNSGTVASARSFIRSSASAIRLGQSNDKVDLFRARGYVSAQSSTDYSITRIGFFNNESGTPTNGCYFEANLAASPYWRAIVVNSSVNSGSPQVVISQVPIVANENRDFKIIIRPQFFANAWTFRAEFYIDDALVSFIQNVPINSGQELFLGANIIKTLGSTNNSLSLDHLGGAPKQFTWMTRLN